MQKKGEGIKIRDQYTGGDESGIENKMM